VAAFGESCRDSGHDAASPTDRAARLPDRVQAPQRRSSRSNSANTSPAIVLEVADDKSLPWQERRAAQISSDSHKSHAATLIELADKISNVRSVATGPPVDWSQVRRRDYTLRR
jgi:hypothetical protein